MDPPDPTFCNFITSYRVRSFSFLYPQQQHETCYSIDAWWKLVEQNWKTILYYSKHRPFGLPNRPSNLMLASDFVTAGSDHASNNLERAGQPSDSIPAAWLTDTVYCLLDQRNEEVWHQWFLAWTVQGTLWDWTAGAQCWQIPQLMPIRGQPFILQWEGRGWQGQMAGFWQTP